MVELLSSVDWLAVIVIVGIIVLGVLIYAGKLIISTPDDKRFIERAFDLAESFAKRTPSTWDDKFVEVGRDVLNIDSEDVTMTE